MIGEAKGSNAKVKNYAQKGKRAQPYALGAIAMSPRRFGRLSCDTGNAKEGCNATVSG